MVTCDGCLGERTCWVCLARGVLDGPDGPSPCHRCFGSGLCPLCQEIKLADIQQPPLLRIGPIKIRRRDRSA